MTRTFSIASRLLHWTMAALILSMLFIGITMVSSLSEYPFLLSIHRPIGFLILILLVARLVNRALNPAPPLPADMPVPLRRVAHASHWLLYGLMGVQPLVGWAMLSAAAYPVVLIGQLHLPPILPHSDLLYSILRPLHTGLALMLLVAIAAHFAAGLMHDLIFRDGVFQSMASWRHGNQP